MPSSGSSNLGSNVAVGWKKKRQVNYCEITFSSGSSNWEVGGGSGDDTTDFDLEGSDVSAWSSS